MTSNIIYVIFSVLAQQFTLCQTALIKFLCSRHNDHDKYCELNTTLICTTSHWARILAQVQTNTVWWLLDSSQVLLGTHTPWWRYQMETFSAWLALCAGTRSFDVFFGLRLNKRLSKQSRRWWFGKPLRSLWRHCKALQSYEICEWNITFVTWTSVFMQTFDGLNRSQCPFSSAILRWWALLSLTALLLASVREQRRQVDTFPLHLTAIPWPCVER